MAIKVAINGFGRIGRCTLRAIYEQGLQNEFEVVAINASGDLATNAHLLKYDTTHGRFRTSVETEGENAIIIDGKKIEPVNFIQLDIVDAKNIDQFTPPEW